MYIPRLRKRETIMKEIKQLDPDTALTEYLIEKLAKSGEIIQIRYGNACLINLDELFDYFHKKDEKK